jgi:hypothetical protein
MNMGYLCLKAGNEQPQTIRCSIHEHIAFDSKAKNVTQLDPITVPYTTTSGDLIKRLKTVFMDDDIRVYCDVSNAKTGEYLVS